MTASNVDVYMYILFESLNDIFIILDCDTALSEENDNQKGNSLVRLL